MEAKDTTERPKIDSLDKTRSYSWRELNGKPGRNPSLAAELYNNGWFKLTGRFTGGGRSESHWCHVIYLRDLFCDE